MTETLCKDCQCPPETCVCSTIDAFFKDNAELMKNLTVVDTIVLDNEARDCFLKALEKPVKPKKSLKDIFSKARFPKKKTKR